MAFTSSKTMETTPSTRKSTRVSLRALETPLVLGENTENNNLSPRGVQAACFD